MSSLKHNSSKVTDFINSIEGIVKGEIRTDSVTRVLYSTDASIYQIEPLGVFFPEDLDDISACVEVASEFEIPILPRGSGSSLAGQAIGPGLILDCSRHLDRIIDINPEAGTATVEPGVILSALNKSLGKFDLQFGPDPASAERATMGGVIGNNATGAHSIRYGMSADHLLSVEVVLSDGSIANFENLELSEARRRACQHTREGEIYWAAISIKDEYSEAIQDDWPQTWRRASGYNLNYLIPWSPSQPPQWSTYNHQQTMEAHPYPPISSSQLNLAALMAGSEGTLGVIRRATVRLVPKPKSTCLVLLAFPDVISACDAVGEILEMQPSAIELIPENMIRLARNVPSYAQQITFLEELFPAENKFPNLLAVEFAGDNLDQLSALSTELVNQNISPALVAEDTDLQQRIWNVRKVGLGLLMSIPGDTKPISFIEDISVPVEKLSEFVAELRRILTDHNTDGDFYAHASAGCLHLRPLINLKSHLGVENMRDIALEAIKLVDRLGGVPSGEHGDGIARSEWLDTVFGHRISAVFRMLKNAADPNGIMNPGKIIDPAPMDSHLRFRHPYSPRAWQPVLDFSKQAGMISAVELCNGAGVCRKSVGVMCPSFQVTKEELHSTRGRANLLRTLFAGNLPSNAKITNEDVFEALDLCLACKGCKAECPSAVDMAALKYEFLERYYSSSGNHRHPVRDYLFAYIDKITRFGAVFNPITNYLLMNMNQVDIVESWLGLSSQRNLPLIAQRSQQSHYDNSQRNHPQVKPDPEKVLILSDPFTEYFHPETGLVALDLLRAAGCEVEFIPEIGSGRTMLSKGFVKSARKHALKVIESIQELDYSGQAAIVGIEPSEIYTLRDEYVDFFPERDEVKSIADRAMMIDEFLIRNGVDGQPRILRIDNFAEELNRDPQEIFLHGHCYQKSQPPAKDGYPIGVQATVALLERAGYRVELIEAGCCGMAGAFGYESEHYDLSMKIGELSLLPQVRHAGEQKIIAASGYSCMTQIMDGTGREAIHPISLIHERLSTRYE
jgi:FAD/FMN-containing dehydrogenase/Fe-S oxidoreductase